MKRITATRIKPARYAVYLRLLASCANAMAAELEDNPEDIKLARKAMRLMIKTCREFAKCAERPLPRKIADEFTDEWNIIAD